jgi:flagellar biosynthetic protein FlhB
VVVAKGKGWLAEKIMEEAVKACVPIYPNPHLAQVLYKTVEVGQTIPVELYRAVAEVLAWAYRLKR